MTRLLSRGLALALIASVLAGCSGGEGRTRPPPASIVVINAVPGYGNLDFRREENDSIAVLAFGEGASDSFDSGPYDFNVDLLPSGTSARFRLATVSATLAPNGRYVFVLSEDGNGTISPFVVEAPNTSPSGSEAQTLIIDAAASGGSYDVYLEPEGTDLLTATSLGNIGYRQHLPPTTRTDGAYRLYLTAPGDPTDVRFESESITLPPGTSSIMTIKDEGGVGVGTLDLVFFGTTSVVFTDANVQSGLRVINAIADMTDRDITLDGAYTPPLFPAVAYGTATDYAEAAPGTHEVNVTPVGNPVDELASAVGLIEARLHTILISGDTTTGLGRAILTDDPRPRNGESTIRFLNGASLLGPIEFYFNPPGYDINSPFVAPQTLLNAPGGSERGTFPPGEYELTLRDLDTQAIVAGPTTVTLTGGGVYEILAVDAVGGSTADVVFLGDFN